MGIAPLCLDVDAAIVTADPATGKATHVERLNLSFEEVETLAGSSAATTRR